MDRFIANLANLLALEGIEPQAIIRVLGSRMDEYSRYRQWVPQEGEGAKGTLLWEAAKHIGESLDLNTHPVFLLEHSNQVLRQLVDERIPQFLTGKF